MEDDHEGMACAPWFPHTAGQPDSRTGDDRYGATIRGEFFGKKAPAFTLVGVTALAEPGWLIEVEAIAVI